MGTAAHEKESASGTHATQAYIYAHTHKHAYIYHVSRDMGWGMSVTYRW